MTTTLLISITVLAALSFVVAPRKGSVAGFYEGQGNDGEQPSLITLVFSQVTTWIFARSLLTAAILGFYYGIGGALAYTAYYLSFFTGAVIVDQIRFRHGFNSVQAFLTDRLGASGTMAYNIVVALRLLSEVFANLIVVGIIFWHGRNWAVYRLGQRGCAFYGGVFHAGRLAHFVAHGRLPDERVSGDDGCAGVLAHRCAGLVFCADYRNGKAGH